MDQHLGIGTRIKHQEYGQGIICKITLSHYQISFFEGGLREIERNDELDIIEHVEAESNTISFDEVESLMVNLIDKYGGLQQTIELGDRWKDGLLVLEPADENLQVKEIPIETFFHKIVMVRDRLRVLEQNINSSKKLDDEDKVNLQQYITRIYGSLTTFNVLFKNKEDHFKGEGRKS